jgi:hypothetical protein
MASTSRRKLSAWSTPSSPGAGHERPDVLGQAAAAEAQAGVEEPAADPGVVAQRLAQQRDVAAGDLAHLGHRVDEGDLGGQERVRGDLDQLRGGEVRDHHRRALALARVDHRREGRPQLRLGLLRRDAEHQPVRAQRVLHGEALAQELRVPRQLQLAAARAGDLLGQPLGRAGRAPSTCPTSSDPSARAAAAR